MMGGNQLVHNQQLIISGVGGQGILFLTRLLAEAAVEKGLPVLSSETHGMAQRGGIVVSHLKVGEFSSPLVRSGAADGMLVLRQENFPLHRSFLKADGWAALNGADGMECGEKLLIRNFEADRLATEAGTVQTVNLVLLGFILAPNSPFPFFCNADDIRTVLEKKTQGKETVRARSLAAFAAGLAHGAQLFSS